jgi:phospholipase A1/A2
MLVAQDGTDRNPYEKAVREDGSVQDADISDDSNVDKLIGLSSHKQNYVLPISFSDHRTRSRQSTEIRFQISLKKRLLSIFDTKIYVAYSQKTYWQYYNIDHSRPIRENNYNPEIFIRSPLWGQYRFDFGMEHESNGLDLPGSRGWNRIYLSPSYSSELFDVKIKGWYRMPKRHNYSANNPRRDDNPDISRYYGYGELNLTLKLNELHINTMLRGNPQYRHGAILAGVSYPLRKDGLFIFFQFFDGYGASLSDYKVNQRVYGLGFLFSR